MAEPFLSVYDPEANIPTFGASQPNVDVYPNDSIVFDIYNYTNDYLESNYRVTNYVLDGFNITINTEEELRKAQYLSGKYNVVARFYRNYLGSGDGDKLVIEEVSSDRFEIRVTPRLFLTGSTNNFLSFFETDFFAIDKADVLPNLAVFKSTFESVRVFDYVQDPFTFDTAPYSIIFKLGAPLPQTIQVGDSIWVSQEISEPVRDSVTVIPVAPTSSLTYIAGPNFDVVTQNTTNIGTDFKDWDDILTTNQDTSLSIIGALFSGSIIEGIKLNIDHREFKNFVHFGSAEERVHNFFYKMQALERYDDTLAALTTDYQTLYPGNSALTSSNAFANNILDIKRKRSNLLSTFDSYERYLYYDSSSYESSSYGEFDLTSWPKTNSTQPYTLASTTSSQAQTWYRGTLDSASLYDLNNDDALRKLIPLHIQQDQANDQYLLFVDMMGHYFDIIYAYVQQLTSINKRYESLTEGFAKDLVFQLGQSLGLNIENGFALEDLWKYVLGVDESGTPISSYNTSLENLSKETWKRIITNLPYLLKTKGTARGIRALINCYGIPSSILRVREFGGPEPTFESSTRDVYDQYFYGLRVSGSEQITIPIANYLDVDGTNGTYGALELRFRPDTSTLGINQDYILLTGPTEVVINPGTDTIRVGGETFSASFSDNDIDWWTLLVNDNDTAYVGTNKYGTAIIYSSSGDPGNLEESEAHIPGQPGSEEKFYGYVNEFRLWSTPLDLDVYRNHILAPTSFQGPQDDVYTGSTSSFSTLKVRHTFGADAKKYNLATTTSVTSSHPDQSSLTYVGGVVRGATFTNYTSDSSSYWIPQTETHYLQIVDGGANRQLGNKIRIETDFVSSSNQLYQNGTILQSLQDLQPVDSARVGVYFSPTDEVNEDISEQFGGISLDDYLGDPAYFYQDDYPNLQGLRREYFKKYKKRNNVQGFARLMQNYDASLFQLVKQFVPERALLHTGLVYESDVLHRTRIAYTKPTSSNDSYEDTINALEDTATYAETGMVSGDLFFDDFGATGGDTLMADAEVGATTTTNTAGEADSYSAAVDTYETVYTTTGEETSLSSTIGIETGIPSTTEYYDLSGEALQVEQAPAPADKLYVTGSNFFAEQESVAMDTTLSDIYTEEVDRLLGYGDFDVTRNELAILGFVFDANNNVTIFNNTLRLEYTP